MKDKVVIKYDIFGTGENEAVFTFDEASETQNKDRFEEALQLIFSQIFAATIHLRELFKAGIETSNGIKIILERGAGQDDYTIKLTRRTNNER